MNRLFHHVWMLACTISVLHATPSLAATNAIRNIQTRQDGGAAIVQIDFEREAPATPGTWSIVEPPRVVIDFPEMTNKTGRNSEAIGVGDVKSLNLVQTEQLTRLVLNLFRASQYSIESRGNSLLVRFESRPVPATTAGEERPSLMTPAPAAPTSGALADAKAFIRNVSFQRGEDAQGIIKIGLSDGTVPIDVRRDGNRLLVEVRSTELPRALEVRRDVNDFATPVAYVSSRNAGDNVRVEVSARGAWYHQTRMTNNELLVEVRPIPPDEVNKLVQAGQTSQKVSINFFEAEATMVLRTLAEISGKNVLVDPSLAGRRITVALDNIPYDQALDIVMAQVSAGMRVTEGVVMFGDRTVLQKRDQERADDRARAADVAPLVTETFEMNFLKASDIEALITAAPGASTGGSGQTNAPVFADGSSAAGSASGNAGASSIKGRGMLSARGSVTRHDGTNKLFVRDTEERIAAIREMIRSVDIPVRQVLIEARIVRADTNFSRDLGLRLGYQDLSSTVPGHGIGTRIAGTNVFGAIAANQSDLVSRTGQAVGGGTTVGSVGSGSNMINLPISANPTGQFAVSVFNSALTRFVNLELQAAEAEGRSVNISSPRVVTANNLEAKIARGARIPYTTSSSLGANTQFVEATLSLSAKPQIAPNGTVIMDLVITNNTLGDGSPPVINVSELKTKVTVENGGTVVLGGVITESSVSSEDRIPLLSDIPYLGKFFKSTSKTTEKGELLVFITPRVLDGNSGVVAAQ